MGKRKGPHIVSLSVNNGKMGITYSSFVLKCMLYFIKAIAISGIQRLKRYYASHYIHLLFVRLYTVECSGRGGEVGIYMYL